MINEYGAKYLNRPRGCIRVAAFITNINFEKLINRNDYDSEKVQFDSKCKFHDGEVYLWACSLSREKLKYKIEGHFLVLQNGSSTYAITGEMPSFMDEGISFLTKCMYPDLISSYVTSEEINTLLKEFVLKNKTELLYSRYIAKKMFGKPVTSLTYAGKRTRKSYDSFDVAFKKTRSEGLWIDNISVFSERNHKTSFSISRNGQLVYYQGNFEQYFENILCQITSMSLKRLKFFEKRGRIDSINRTPKPLKINFDTNVFEDSSVRKQLIAVINEYAFCNYSIVHDGNPHLYVNIVDRKDNSAFALRTFGSDSLLITPAIKATSESLMRFSKHLVDNFREGEILDYIPQGGGGNKR